MSNKNESSLDLSKEYEIKPRFIDNDPTGLGAYGRSSYPDTTKLIFCPIDYNLSKFSTGLDHLHPTVLSISDPAKRKARQEELIAIKEELESILGISLDPNIESSFWNNFAVVMGNDSHGNAYMDVKGRTFSLKPTENPYHKLAVIFLKHNNLLPASKEEAGEPKFREAKYLLTTADEINKDAKERVRVDQTRGKNLSELFGDNINYDRAWEIAYYLGYGPKKNMSEDLLNELLYEKTMVLNEAKRFNKAMSEDNQTIATANLFKQALKLGIIKHNKNDDFYYRGGINYRSTEAESIQLLLTDAMSTELAQLREAVQKKSKTMKNLS